MSRSAEDILLQVQHVKHKKNEGILYVMGERIAWMAGHKSDKFAINHKYADVKTQKISPEGKSKIQLQVVLHDGNSTTFHFVHPEGQAVQLRDRESVKELLQQLLPKFKKQINKALEEKNRLLSENPGLLQLYKDLVITQILTADEFWNQHAAEFAAKDKKIKEEKLAKKQNVGVSGSFLSEIKPQADGANGLKYNLTTDIMQSIFKTYPAVKRKHAENVPHNISEQEFWTKFFQSHYFHRDRLHTKGVKDIFTECSKEDDKAMKHQLAAGVSDRLVNIESFNDKTLDEHYGGANGNEVSSSSSANAKTNDVHKNIIKRFNQHSIMVMNIANDSKLPTPTQSTNSSKTTNTSVGSSDLSNSNSIENTEDTNVINRKRLLEKTEYEDLDNEPEKKTATLNLAKADRYLSGPTTISSSSTLNSGTSGQPDLSPQALIQWRQNLASELQSWSIQGDCKDILTARTAVSALNDLSPGGALMKAARQELLAGQYPESVQQDLKILYGSLSELLRHFWACFPPTTPQLQEKAIKMHDTLQKYQHKKLRPFENELIRQYSSGPKITIHLNRMLEAAERKFSTWQQKMSKR